MINKHLFLKLPFPPSNNSLYSGKARRFTSPRYKAWQKLAIKAIQEQKTDRLHGMVFISYGLQRPDKRHRDEENYMKALSDILVKQGIITDDSQSYGKYIYWLNEYGHDVHVNIYLSDQGKQIDIANMIHAMHTPTLN